MSYMEVPMTDSNWESGLGLTSSGAAQPGGEEVEELLWRAAALENYGERLLAQSADMENEGLELVASYERQRQAVVRAQVRLHGAEVSQREPELLVLADAFLHEEERKRWLWRQAESRWEKSRQCLARAQSNFTRAGELRRRVQETLAAAAFPRGASGETGEDHLASAA
jgi:hypothetical protein